MRHHAIDVAEQRPAPRFDQFGEGALVAVLSAVHQFQFLCELRLDGWHQRHVFPPTALKSRGARIAPARRIHLCVRLTLHQ